MQIQFLVTANNRQTFLDEIQCSDTSGKCASEQPHTYSTVATLALHVNENSADTKIPNILWETNV